MKLLSFVAVEIDNEHWRTVPEYLRQTACTPIHKRQICINAADIVEVGVGPNNPEHYQGNSHAVPTFATIRLRGETRLTTVEDSYEHVSAAWLEAMS